MKLPFNISKDVFQARLWRFGIIKLLKEPIGSVKKMKCSHILL
jgi:hypothetical protein